MGKIKKFFLLFFLILFSFFLFKEKGVHVSVYAVESCIGEPTIPGDEGCKGYPFCSDLKNPEDCGPCEGCAWSINYPRPPTSVSSTPTPPSGPGGPWGYGQCTHLAKGININGGKCDAGAPVIDLGGDTGSIKVENIINNVPSGSYIHGMYGPKDKASCLNGEPN